MNKIANKNGVKNEKNIGTTLRTILKKLTIWSINVKEANGKAYIIDFSVANLKNGKKIAYAKKWHKLVVIF